MKPGMSMASAPVMTAMRPARPMTPVVKPKRTAPRRVAAAPGLLLGAPSADTDFTAEVKQLFALLTCEGKKPDRPCKSMNTASKAYKRLYLKPIRQWLKGKRPRELPAAVLYPFSGGDLVSALSFYPKQRQFVHLSLEHAGPVTALRGLKPARVLAGRFKAVWIVGSLLNAGESFSVDLQKNEQAELPGVLPMILLGLHVHGGKPTGLSYFAIQKDGTAKRFTRAELNAAGPKAKRHYRSWKDPKFSKRFSNVELRFRLPGDTTDRSIIHIAANLSNKGMGARPEVLKLIGQLPKHNVMIKAASYLLWNPYFSQIRDRIYAKAVWGISDVTAPYPKWLRKNGFRIDVYGRFDGLNKKHLHASSIGWRTLFKRPRARHIPFRYGYPDKNMRNYVVLVSRTGAAPAAAMKPAVMKPAVMKPAAMKPAVMKPAVMKPAVMKPAAMRPAKRPSGM
jgi:hypothetical protein